MIPLVKPDMLMLSALLILMLGTIIEVELVVMYILVGTIESMILIVLLNILKLVKKI